MSSAALLVLVVDDDFRVRESIESLLESAGYVSRTFASAAELLGSGALSGAACVVTDVRMAGMGGLNLQRAIRSEQASLPVIFISAHVDDALRIRALRDGGSAFLYKPFAVSELLDAIRRAVEPETLST